MKPPPKPLRSLLAGYRSRSLFQQLLIPIIAVGVIGVSTIIVSAYLLARSVDTLWDAYSVGTAHVEALQEADKALAEYRALSLRHQTTENAAAMGSAKADLGKTRQDIERTLSSIAGTAAAQDAASVRSHQELSKVIARYFADIDEAIRLSAEFEKERSFELLSRAESEHLTVIRSAMQTLTRGAFDAVAASRTNLVESAGRNLLMTIAICLLGGVILLGMAFYVSRRTSQRIGQLLAWSHRIARGDLSNVLVTDSTDEIGQLASAMGGMVENLAQGRAALERARKDAEAVAEELRLYANAFESSGNAMLITDRESRIINVNTAFTEQTGYSFDDVRGKDPKLLASGNTPATVYESMWNALDNDGFWEGELWDRKKSGEIYPKWLSISAILGENREVAFYIASFSDISERKENEKRIDYLAHHDALTGLINRYNLQNRLSQSILTAQREGMSLAVLFIDMDRFKDINDTLGHHVGDLLLIEVANRLRDCVRDSDIVARLGGDEFVVVLTAMTSSMDTAPIAENILRSLGRPYPIEGHRLHSTPSIGVAVFPDDGQDGHGLMKNADTAMYHAKDNGRNNVQYFTAAMNAAAIERLSLEGDLRQALRDGRLEVHYQPQVRADDGRCCGMEALARWNHPERGAVPPMTFIRIAEESSLIEELGDWVLDQACQQVKRWRKSGFDTIHVAVNLSARQLRSTDFVKSVAQRLQHHDLKGSDLELEITESVAMENPERAIGQLEALRDLGIRLAIDDFGTGYSSLSYLKRLPIQVLKLDRSFVRDIESDANDAAISAATLALAHSLGLKVVAEGVETDGQHDFLVKHRCDVLQGYLYSRPLSSEGATQFLKESVGSAAAFGMP